MGLEKYFHGSLACLKTRGMMVSFETIGSLDPVNVPKDIQPKGFI